MRRTALRRSRPLRSRRRLTRRTALTRTPLVRRGGLPPASPAQRAKVAGERCIVCRKATRVDPAHLVPRALGGCDEPDCVAALCREHHRAYDRGELDLLPHLEPVFRVELAHAVMHLGLIGALRRLTGRRPSADDASG